MEHFIWRRSGAAALTAALALQLCCTSPVFAAEQDKTGQLFSKQDQDARRPPDADEPVRIIIELDDAPLLDDHSVMRTFSSAEAYLSSAHAQSREASLAAARDRACRAMARSGLRVQVEHEYSAVLNGISVVARQGDLDAIRKLDGVKNAFVAERYELIEPVAYEPLLHDSVPVIGGDLVHDLAYTGKGSVVAILDTGLDTDHEAFSPTVNGARYSKEDIRRIQMNNRLTVGTLDVDVLYKSEKIPYAYDYADKDTNVIGGDSHGTHVAGITAANGGSTITGVAPDAQLLIMKVFGDIDPGAYDDDILAALDDAVMLGADVINMSLGTPAGFSEAGTAAIQQAYQRVADAGVSLMCAAGNAYSAAYHGASGNDLSMTANPDNSTVSSPSTYGAALSVASSNNAVTTAPYILHGTRQIRYHDSGDTPAEQLASLKGVFPYEDCGVGSTADFQGVSLAGKIALIQRGGEDNGSVLTFAQKEINARNAGAAAVFIYDNVEGDLIAMACPHNIPCVFLSRADGEWLLAQTDRQVTLDPAQMGQFQDAYSGKMSDFSSWGVSPDLKLKPEITAPGGNIYSSMPHNGYGSMSGTSMASPHMAGAAAVMNQYLMEQQDGLSMSPAGRRDLANALMMSTAVPVLDENGNPASPRKQGAGLVQLDKAVRSKAYLLSDTGSRPLANLGDSPDGTFGFRFQACNLQSAPIRYQVDVTVQTESVVHDNGLDYIAEQARVLTDREVTVTAPAAVELTGKGKTSVPVSLKLTETGRQELSAQFPNGIFVEGFVTLTPVSGDSIPLSIPFMGFYGDWAAVPIFDATLYSGDPVNMTDMWLGLFRNYDGGGYVLGKSQYGSGQPVIGADKIAIKGNDRSHHVTSVCALLRNVDNLVFTVTNSGSELVYREINGRDHKSVTGDTSFYTPMAKKGWMPFDEWNDPLPDGRYTYTVTGTVDGRDQSVSFPITVDSVAPQVISSVVEGSVWKVTVQDNHYIQSVCATLGTTPLTGWINPDESVPGAATVVEFDLSDPAFQGLKECRIAMADYADNQFVSGFYSLSGASVVLPESISLDKTQLEMKVGDTSALTAEVLPAHASNRTVTWSSSAADVVSVGPAGQLNALAEGSAVITGKTVNGLTASCTVTVRAAEVPPVPVPGKAMASIRAPGAVTGPDVPIQFQLEQMSGVATVSFTFERDSALTGGIAEDRNGFTALDGIHWKGNTGVLMLCYLKDGAGGTLSRQELTDVARVVFQTSLEQGKAGLTLTGVRVSGYDAHGNAVYLDSGIRNARVDVAVGTSDLDVNRDGVVDQLDITACQQFYQAARGDADWNQAQICDVDHNGVVDVEDMVTILLAFRK